jgi:hypothetical protein
MKHGGGYVVRWRKPVRRVSGYDGGLCDRSIDDLILRSRATRAAAERVCSNTIEIEVKLPQRGLHSSGCIRYGLQGGYEAVQGVAVLMGVCVQADSQRRLLASQSSRSMRRSRPYRPLHPTVEQPEIGAAIRRDLCGLRGRLRGQPSLGSPATDIARG